MRKIDKSAILSLKYKEWEEGLEVDKHPKYASSSKNKYYHDIKMSLLYCQKGLCAYTEQLLCDTKYLDQENWDNERYTKVLSSEDRYAIQGDLEHFDSSLKTNNAWLWDNLFVVATHNNCRIKGSKPIKPILKPDSPNYDPYKYLTFDSEEGIFGANRILDDAEKEDVEYMIRTLGLNCIANERKRQIKQWLDMRDMGMEVDAYRYVTAWEMTKDNLESNVNIKGNEVEEGD